MEKTEKQFFENDKFMYEVLKYIFSAHDICEIEWM